MCNYEENCIYLALSAQTHLQKKPESGNSQPGLIDLGNLNLKWNQFTEKFIQESLRTDNKIYS